MVAPRPDRRSAFTLIELVIALGVMTVLIGGMASAVLVASKAMPAPESLASRTNQGEGLAADIGADLAIAVRIVSMEAKAVTFEVPDRGYGAVGPETLAYSWSGTPGDPLTRSVNGAAPVTLAEDVHHFSLECVSGTSPLARTPGVLLVVDKLEDADGADDIMALKEDALRRQLVESWGFSVTLIEDSAPLTQYRSAYAVADVMYVSCQIGDGDLSSDKPLNIPIGIVNEHGGLYDELGIAGGDSSGNDDTLIFLTETSHEITRAFAPGWLEITGSIFKPLALNDTLAPDVEILASTGSNPRTLGVLDAGARAIASGRALGRRVKLPWGDPGSFTITELNDDGRALLRRSLVWAAAPVVVGEAVVRLQIGSDAGGRVETSVILLNQPRWPASAYATPWQPWSGWEPD